MLSCSLSTIFIIYLVKFHLIVVKLRFEILVYIILEENSLFNLESALLFLFISYGLIYD